VVGRNYQSFHRSDFDANVRKVGLSALLFWQGVQVDEDCQAKLVNHTLVTVFRHFLF
jgi:hypothetical protein